MELLGRRGTAEVSIEQIARAAGVSNGLLYHYFPTKSDFLLAVLKRSQRELDTRLARDPGCQRSNSSTATSTACCASSTSTRPATSPRSNARGREPRVQALVEERRRRRVDELVALAAALGTSPATPSGHRC